jgi:hypothetical protein
MTLPEVDERVRRWADEAWPLRFKSHSFGVRCWNVQRCSVIYDNYEHGTVDPYIYTLDVYLSAGAPPNPDWKDRWSGRYTPYRSDLLTPVEIAWISLDGGEHTTTVDLDAIFKDRLVLHKVKREDIPLVYLVAWGKGESLSVDILLEVNDRMVNVYSRAAIVVGDREDLDDIDKRDTRYDLILAWTHTY